MRGAALCGAWLLLCVAGYEGEWDFDKRQVSQKHWRCSHLDVQESLAAARAAGNASRLPKAPVEPHPHLVHNLTDCRELWMECGHEGTSGGNFEAEDAPYLAAALDALAPTSDGNADALNMLDMERCHMGDAGMVALAPSLGASRSLTALHVHDNWIGDASVIALRHAFLRDDLDTDLYAHPSLSLLDLDGNMIGDKACHALFHLLRTPRMSLAPIPLTDLRLSSNLITLDGVTQIAEGLRANEGRLKILFLSGNAVLDKGTAVLAWALKQNTGLQQLYLSDVGMTDVGAFALAEAVDATSAPIEVVEIRYNERVTAGGLKRLEAAVDASIERLGMSPYPTPAPLRDNNGRDYDGDRDTGLFRLAVDENGRRLDEIAREEAYEAAHAGQWDEEQWSAEGPPPEGYVVGETTSPRCA